MVYNLTNYRPEGPISINTPPKRDIGFSPLAHSPPRSTYVPPFQKRYKDHEMSDLGTEPLIETTYQPGTTNKKGYTLAMPAEEEPSEHKLRVDLIDIVNSLSIVTKLQGRQYQWKIGSTEELDYDVLPLIQLLIEDNY